MINLYLIRHLATEKNISGVVMGQDETPIVESGTIEFNQRIDNYFDKDSPLFKIYSSPRLRCVQTANLLRSRLKIDRQTELSNLLDETDMGNFEGKTFYEIKQEFPELYNLWINDLQNLTFPNGESIQSAFTRSQEFLRSLQSNAEENIVCVTHVDNIKFMIMGTTKTPINSKKLLHIDNASISKLEFDNGIWKVKFQNLL